MNVQTNVKTKNAGKAPENGERTSLSQQAYIALRDEVLNHRLPVGELLNERWLCDRLGFGRTPVHQALLRLHQEDLIHVVPRKGVLVRPDSIVHILDLLDARSIIEPELARRAAGRATPNDLEDLRRIASESQDREDAPAGIVDRFIARDCAFHARLAQISGNPVLIDMQKALHERAMRFWHSNLWRTLDESKTSDEHAAVIDAISRQDPAGAAAAMSAHIAEITNRLRQLQAKTPAQG